MAASSTSPKTRSKAAPAAKKAGVKKKSVKLPSKKPALKKNALNKNAATKKLTVQEQLTHVEARLKRANAVTRKNVKILEQLVTSLESKSKTARTTQKAEFTRQVNALNKKLTGLMENSQTQIAKDLSVAMKSPNMADLEAALTRADDRLAQTEVSQADAITKINRHLANLASALETRFEDETAARTAAITASEAKLEQVVTDKTANLTRKVEAIETDTSEALELLGEKVENFAIELDQRQSRIDTHMGEKVSEIALQTQVEFETFRSNIDQRLTDISSRTPANTTAGPDPRLDGQINILEDRLQNLEQYLADMKFQNPADNNLQSPHNGLGQPIQTPAPPLPRSTNILAPLPTHNPAQAPSNIIPINDAFAPAQAEANPYAAPPAPPAAQEAPKPSHIPMEFDPAAYQASPPQASENLNASLSPDLPAPMQSTMPPFAPIVAQAVMTPPPELPRDLPPMGASGEYNAPNLGEDLSSTSFASLTANVDAVTGPSLDINNAANPSHNGEYVEPALPYADPAYAENSDAIVDTDMRAERIGGPNKASGKKLHLPKADMSKLPISSGPLKYLLFGSALAVILVFAGKLVIGGGDKYAPIPAQSAQAGQTNSSPFKVKVEPANTAGANSAGFTLGGETQAPIGQYAENIVPVIDKTAARTLDGAAASGDPIAQYQLGLSSLKTGDIDTGVKLIRASASQNLPAAQYRLAKLYEIGKGVERDEAQARQLTERAAKSGHRIAMHDLALYYTDGRGGVEVNVATAKGWFEQAAEHGVVDSQFNLAVLAESQTELPQNLETAYFWYYIAAQQGDQIAQKRVQFISDGLSPEQIDAVNSRIAAFTPRPVNPEVNGVFRNAPWNAPTQSVKVEQIRQAQSYLAELGYNVGAPDGAIGPNTRAAISEFEKANELPETGTVDDKLIDRLELAVGA